MKICIVVPSFFPAVSYGGVIFAPYFLGLAFSKLNKEVLVSTTDANGPYKRLPMSSSIPVELATNYMAVYHRNTYRDQFSISFLLNSWRQIKWADVVFVNALFCPVVPIALVYCRIFGRPVMLSPRGELGLWCLAQGNRFKKMWLKLLIAPFSKRIKWHATSEQESKEIAALFPEADILKIPDGVRMQDFSESVTLNPPAFAERFLNSVISPSHIIVSLGRLHKVKGFDILIKSFSVIRATYPNAILAIAGPDEGERQPLLHLINSMSLNDAVFLIGPLDGQDKVDFLGNADLFALSSHNENFGIVYAEALAAGTPIVATHGTPWERVEEYKCGRWVPNTIETVAEAIVDLLSRENKTEMRSNAQALIRKFYTWETIAQQFQAAFAAIAKQH